MTRQNEALSRSRLDWMRSSPASLRQCKTTAAGQRKTLDAHDAARYIQSSGPPTWNMARVIKKYENRKLYDLEAKRYVRLRDLAELIRAGTEVVVIENDTGADVTAATLTKLMSEGAGQGEPFLPSHLLHEVVRKGEELMASGMNHLLHRSLERTGLPRTIRQEMAELRERLDKLETMVNELDKEEGHGDNDDGRGGKHRNPDH